MAEDTINKKIFSSHEKELNTQIAKGNNMKHRRGHAKVQQTHGEKNSS